MKLIISNTSPFVRKVRVLAREAGIADQIEEVEVMTTPFATASEAAAANPVGKIPALVREDGPAIYDSRVICRYLDAKAGAGFYPEARIWEVLTLEASADAILEAAVASVYEVRLRDEAQQSSAWIEAQEGKAKRGMAAIEDRWMSHLNGPLDAAQIAVACACGYIDFRLGSWDWRAELPQLGAWYDRFAARETMTSTVPS